jgi:hypothetical protein
MNPQEFVPGAPAPNGGMAVERLAPLVELIAKQGLTPTDSGQGNDKEPGLAPAYFMFPDDKQALEFVEHTQHHMNYLLGDQIGLFVHHPVEDGPPQGKVCWVPAVTEAITEAWRRSLVI